MTTDQESTLELPIFDRSLTHAGPLSTLITAKQSDSAPKGLSFYPLGLFFVNLAFSGSFFSGFGSLKMR